MKSEDPVWFDDMAVGRDPLNNVMKQLSLRAELSQVYTNHSIRATAITTLVENNVEACHIQAVSGHKCESTIHTYSKKCSSKKKREMFDILALDKSSAPPVKKSKPVPTATVSKPPSDMNDPNFDFLDFVPIDNNSDD